MLSSRSSSNRKPLGDLTNQLSATSLDDRNHMESSSSKVSIIKAQISEESEKKKDPVDVKTPDVPARQARSSVEVEKQEGAKSRVKSRPANLTNLGVSSLENFPPESAAAMFPPPPSPLTPGSFFYLGAPSSSGFQLMTPLSFTQPPPLSGSHGQDSVAYVMEPGYISLKLSHGIVLDIATDLSVRLLNPRQNSSIALCGDGDCPQVAIIHPLGRAIVYDQRAEIQMEDEVSVKNTKFYPRGISFTANHLAMVYRLDQVSHSQVT